MWINLDGDYFNVSHAFALRSSGKDKCVLFSAGASPVDGGHLINLPISDVFEAVQSARMLEIAEMLAEQKTQDDPDDPDDPDDQRSSLDQPT